MRKKIKGRKLHRQRDQRKALLKSLAQNLVLKEKIKTTEAKAKELKTFLEPEITKAKAGTLHARREIAKFFSQEAAKKLITDLAPRYKDRKGGYTRIIKLGPRNSDGSKMAIIEFVR